MYYQVRTNKIYYYGPVCDEYSDAFKLAADYLDRHPEVSEVTIQECNQEGRLVNRNYQEYGISRSTVAKERARQAAYVGGQ